MDSAATALDHLKDLCQWNAVAAGAGARLVMLGPMTKDGFAPHPPSHTPRICNGVIQTSPSFNQYCDTFTFYMNQFKVPFTKFKMNYFRSLCVT